MATQGIIRGEDLSVFKAVSIFACQAKKENNDGIKAKYAVVVYKDRDGGDTVRDIMWQDNLGEAWDVIWAHRKLDDAGQPVKDVKGGYVVDIAALKKSCLEFKKSVDEDEYEDSAQEDILTNILKARGGVQCPYTFPTGPRYANDVDGKPVLRKDGTRVQKSTISVFVRIKYRMEGDDGKMQTVYVGGVSPEVKGEELMQRFYKVPVQQVVAPTPSPAQEATEKNEEEPF